MSKLAEFFQGSDTHLGVFYPKHYLLAVFPDLREAEEAARRLVLAGRPSEDVIAVPGEDVIDLMEEHHKNDGLWGLLMTEMSRLIDTEAVYADEDLKIAKRGAAFLAVRCRSEAAKLRVWSKIEPAHPLVARYYGNAGIEHLVGES